MSREQTETMANDRRTKLRKTLATAREVMWLWIVLHIVGGIALCANSRTVVVGRYYAHDDKTYPYIGAGIGVIIFGILTGFIIHAALRYMQWRVAEAAEAAEVTS